MSNIEEKEPVIVIADTHLGLLRRYPRIDLGGWLSNELECDSVELCHFLEWTKGLCDSREEEVTLGRWGGCDEKFKIRKPGTIVLLGDFVELWDASDAAVEFASREIWRTLAEIAEKNIKIVYVVGNHDFAISDIAEGRPPSGRRGRFFPIGNAKVEIVEDTYPVKYSVQQSSAEPSPQVTLASTSGPPTAQTAKQETRDDLQTISLGGKRYVFLHGQQFDTLFRHFKAWTIMSYIRDGAEAFRLYSWLIPGFASLWILYSWLIGGRIQWTPFVLLLMLGGVPRLFASVARPFFSKARSLNKPNPLVTRYNRKKALDGFLDWWEDQQVPDGSPITVIYGHTHLAYIFYTTEINNAMQKRNVLVRSLWAFLRLLRRRKGLAKVENVSLINISAWVEDRSPGHQPVLRDAALYIDGQGTKFIGWRWPGSLGTRDPGGPFYIPDEVIRSRADGKPLGPQMLSDLEKLKWPPKMLGYWGKVWRDSPLSAGVR